MGSPPRYQSQRPSTEQSTSPVMPVTRLRHPAVCPYSRPNVAVALTGHGGYSQGTVQNFVMGRCTIPLSPDRSPLRGRWGGTRPAQSHHHVCLNEPTSEPRRGSGRMAQGVNTRRPRFHSGTLVPAGSSMGCSSGARTELARRWHALRLPPHGRDPGNHPLHEGSHPRHGGLPPPRPVVVGPAPNPGSGRRSRPFRPLAGVYTLHAPLRQPGGARPVPLSAAANSARGGAGNRSPTANSMIPVQSDAGRLLVAGAC